MSDKQYKNENGNLVQYDQNGNKEPLSTEALDTEDTTVNQTFEHAKAGNWAGHNKRHWNALLREDWEKLSVDSPIVPSSNTANVEGPRVILDDDGTFKMLYYRSDNTYALATTDALDGAEWNKYNNGSPVLDSADYAETNGGFYQGGFLKGPNGTYYVVTCTEGDSYIHTFTADDPTGPWTHAARYDTGYSNFQPSPLDVVRIGPRYYILSRYANADPDTNNDWAMLHYTTDLTDPSLYMAHNGNPVIEADQANWGTPSMTVLGNVLYVGWEEYPDGDWSGSVIELGALPVGRIEDWGVPTNKAMQFHQTDDDTITTSSSGFEFGSGGVHANSQVFTFPTNKSTQRSTIHGTRDRTLVRLSAYLSNDTAGETTSVVMMTGDNDVIVSITSSTGASNELNDSFWVEPTVNFDDFAEDIKTLVQVSDGTGTIERLSFELASAKQLTRSPANPGFVATGSSGEWDDEFVAEGYIQYFGGEYAYLFYEGQDTDTGTSQIGVARASLK